MSRLNRRQMLASAGAGLLGWGCLGRSASGWLPALAEGLANAPSRRRHCVLLWMSGGASQLDTFDLKPGHANGGPFAEIETSVPGLRISEHLPKLARHGDKLAVCRGLSTSEGDHSRGTFLMHTGFPPGGPIAYPTIGAALSKELGRSDTDLPNFVSIAQPDFLNRAAFSPGFLGPRYASLKVGQADVTPGGNVPDEGFAELGVDDLISQGGSHKQQAARLDLWRTLQEGFLAGHGSSAPNAHQTVYDSAVRMMQSEAVKAFDLSQETDAVRERYGRGQFGQGCLMARRLIERGVPFIEVGLSNWDTHQDNFDAVAELSAQLDSGWSALMTDLSERGLLESTTILWMGEFGRTPRINPQAGRDHFPNAWSCVLAGGGINGGQAFGETSPDGMEVVDGKIDIPDVLATLCKALGVDPETQNISDLGRPIRIAEGTAIKGILA
ncbi:MAG: DUF1501 domain-containing protein [Pirellulales bacterium]|nr:DUF1501 domain-containing protein [Pirellulales bacterium]